MSSASGLSPRPGQQPPDPTSAAPVVVTQTPQAHTWIQTIALVAIGLFQAWTHLAPLTVAKVAPAVAPSAQDCAACLEIIKTLLSVSSPVIPGPPTPNPLPPAPTPQPPNPQPPIPQPNPIQPPTPVAPPDTPLGLARKVYGLLAVVTEADLTQAKRQAGAIAASFRAAVSAAPPGVTVQQLIAETTAKNTAAIDTDKAKWLPWFKAVQTALNELSASGKLNTTADYIAAWNEIALGLETATR